METETPYANIALACTLQKVTDQVSAIKSALTFHSGLDAQEKESLTICLQALETLHSVLETLTHDVAYLYCERMLAIDAVRFAGVLLRRAGTYPKLDSALGFDQPHHDRVNEAKTIQWHETDVKDRLGLPTADMDTQRVVATAVGHHPEETGINSLGSRMCMKPGVLAYCGEGKCNYCDGLRGKDPKVFS